MEEEEKAGLAAGACNLHENCAGHSRCLCLSCGTSAPMYKNASSPVRGMAYAFPGILARLRAIASSTAFSCFSSSSRRDSVLAFPDLVLAAPGSEALPGTLVTLLELLDCGDSWRFLSAGAAGALEFWPLCRSGFGEPSLPPDFRSREPRSGDVLARLAGGGLCLSLSDGS